jgi:hypothetical protein
VKEVASLDDGYRAVVILSYTNILNEDNFMEIVIDYDSAAAFRRARITKCNDRWATPAKLVDMGRRGRSR